MTVKGYNLRVMHKRSKKSDLSSYRTYVFIDASNIRSACLKSLGFKIDFMRLRQYLQGKYPNLKELRYYEGIADNDFKKRQYFRQLGENGYNVCGLERKAYQDVTWVTGKTTCPNCKVRHDAKIKKKTTALKSNVDVYLATDFIIKAMSVRRKVHLIIVSCDGDYAEMIKAALGKRKRLFVTVLATPARHDKRNTLSSRITALRRERNFVLRNIDNIRNRIEQQRSN